MNGEIGFAGTYPGKIHCFELGANQSVMVQRDSFLVAESSTQLNIAFVKKLGAGFFGGDDVPTPIVDGKIEGDRVTFKSGDSTYTGVTKSSRIELQRSFALPWETPAPPKEDPNRPAIGPAPDGSDPSIDTTWEVPSSIPVVLHRVVR